MSKYFTKEKIEFVIFLVHYFLLGLIILSFCAFSIILCVSFYYDLTDFYKGCIISIGICCFLLYELLTFQKFKELRKKFKKNRKRGK